MSFAPYYMYWGKARPAEESQAAFHLLPYHCLDVAAAGMGYLRRAPAVRAYFAQSLGLANPECIERWVGFWLLLHDLGKFAEAFQGQRRDLLELLQKHIPTKTYTVRHDSLGMLFWKAALLDRAIDEEWFGPETEIYADDLNWWMRGVTGHHGQPPIENNDAIHFHFNGQSDHQAIFQFVDAARSLLLDEETAAIPSLVGAECFEEASKELSWWMAGIAVLADWIGSNTEYFAYRANYNDPTPLPEYWQHAQAQAVIALDAAGVLPVEGQSLLTLSALFPYIETPSPLQDWSTNVPLVTGSQLHILEDVTGAGKTEAAVMLAHRLISGGHADGFFIGLPTMATANAMYGRIARVYDKLFSTDASLALAHGQRSLVESFAISVLHTSDDENDRKQSDETATARCTAWLADHNKRALLAPAGVGTIDQALLAVLHSKHQSLRLLGLFRKVLIVDEVHACDRYMQTVLETLLEFHAAAGGSAILLSATLPQHMKQSLLNAFARGRKLSAPNLCADEYPLVSSWYSSQPSQVTEEPVATRDDVVRDLNIHYVSDESEVVAAIEAALSEGKCVCWMRNTVADAIAAYEIFEARMSAGNLLLFHARFSLRDRLDTEEKILNYFGKDSAPADRAGRLVIATQVAEQSLDADWDFVVTDLAPIDRLIQRAGRLQRHPRDSEGRRLIDRTARDRRGDPCLWVYGPAWTDEPPSKWFKEKFAKAAHVYPNHAELWLSARLLQSGRISMPGEARELIETVFGNDADLPSTLQASADKAEGQGYSDASIAQMNAIKIATGYTRGGFDWWSEAKTPSRLGDASTNVLLAKWDGDTLRPWADHPNPRHAWAYSTVRAAERLIAQTAEPETAERRAELERVLTAMPNKGKWAVLLPLENTANGWTGQAMDKPTRREPQRLTWTYDAKKGLLQSNSSVGEDE